MSQRAKKLFSQQRSLLGLLGILLLFVQACSFDGSEGRTGRGLPATVADDGTPPDTGDLEEILGVELLSILDPQDGAFRSKVSIPKNYAGMLYITGINIPPLGNNLVYVRLRFGRDVNSIELPAAVTTVPGQTSTTQVPALELNFASRPLSNRRLFYNLFDYTNYNFAAGDEPNYENERHASLFCRGLKLQDDPTFNGTGTNSICNQSGSVCKYTYAKILDKGLVANSLALSPSERQMDLSNSGFNQDLDSNKIKKCLPDNGDVYNDGNLIPSMVDPSFSGATLVALGGSAQEISGTSYDYEGPYALSSDSTAWEIQGDARIGANGLFKALLPSSTQGIQSLMFPRYGKLPFAAGVEHLSAIIPDGSKEVTSLTVGGDSDWMDGCNLRVATRSPSTFEDISSCTVSATIEVYTEDQTGERSFLTSTKELKLQLTRTSNSDGSHGNTTYSSYLNCTSSSACAADSCCMNGRCWEKTQQGGLCPDQISNSGSNPVGAACPSGDGQCQSLCCKNGFCQPHDNTSNATALCSKSLGGGETCQSNAFCAPQTVRNCMLVQTGMDNFGQMTCSGRCYSQELTGQCVDGFCTSRSDIISSAYTDFINGNTDCSAAVPAPITLGPVIP